MAPRFEGYRYSGAASGVCLIWALFMETVLIVEDELTTSDTLVELLGKDGRAIATAGDGQEALERLTEVPRPSLILLDRSMPRMNCWECLRRLSTESIDCRYSYDRFVRLQPASWSKESVGQTFRH
jgi:CheY-like chemotaxis protein